MNDPQVEIIADGTNKVSLIFPAAHSAGPLKGKVSLAEAIQFLESGCDIAGQSSCSIDYVGKCEEIIAVG